MSYYVGIDLGTTNSVICTYDGTDTRIWKSPEQNDVTPSAIFIDKRGNSYYGQKAYNQAPYNPDNSAILFKRFMGTNNVVTFAASGMTKTPEECSAELLRVLFGYLPEEIRESDISTVITVPAAFNQVKKDATLKAAQMAGLGNVALMQEPVAAIMCVMKDIHQKGVFLIYDLGGGTFDVAVAENIKGKVSLLAHGGVEMCGGRDIDRLLFNNIVVPWLNKTFSLPDDFLFNKKYLSFVRIAQWATERAKIELSSNENSYIALTEAEARTADEDGEEMYLDIPLSRNDIDSLIDDLISETIHSVKETMHKINLSASDVDSIIFIGGPTQYKPLRDKVSNELSIKANNTINPMTAVAEGASIYAESINWSSEEHTRKDSKAVLKSKANFEYKYISRTSEDSAKLMCALKDGEVSGEIYSIEVTNPESGWSSGQAILEPGKTDSQIFILPLALKGDNRFNICVYDNSSNKNIIEKKSIVISKVIASVSSIVSSQSIGIELMERVGTNTTLDFIVRDGERLPKHGSINLRSSSKIESGSDDSINIKLWEGEIQSPVEDNRFIGVLKISGTDFDYGCINIGDPIECEYHVYDSGNIVLDISVPSVGVSFSGKNFYTSNDGKIDLDDIDSIADEGKALLDRIDQASEVITGDDIDIAKRKAENAAMIASSSNASSEDIQKASSDLIEAKKLLYKTKLENSAAMHKYELDCSIQAVESIYEYFNDEEKREYEILRKKAEKSLSSDETTFSKIISDISQLCFGVLIRQDWFLVDIFRSWTKYSANYTDIKLFNKLKAAGEIAIRDNKLNELRPILAKLSEIRKASASIDDMYSTANIMRG